MFDWLKKLINVSQGSIEIEAAPVPKAQQEDDKWLAGFGYKVNWYMIPEYELTNKGWSIQGLADAIGLKNQNLMLWNDGVGFGYKYTSNNDKQIYISAPFDGWIYIINATESELDLLNSIVANYYAFGSYRVVDYVAWKQVKDNEVIRHFIYVSGEVLANIGIQTEEECALDFVNLSGLDNNKAAEAIVDDRNIDDESIVTFFDEDHAIEMCIRWTGKDPSRFDELVIPLDERPKVGIGGILIR